MSISFACVDIASKMPEFSTFFPLSAPVLDSIFHVAFKTNRASFSEIGDLLLLPVESRQRQFQPSPGLNLLQDTFSHVEVARSSTVITGQVSIHVPFS